MSSSLDAFAELAASWKSPVDPAEIFAGTLADASGKSAVIYDEDLKDAYIRKLSGEIREKMPEFSDLPLDDFYNYAVYAARPVKITGANDGKSYAATPIQLESMASAAGVPAENLAPAAREFAKIARSGESLSDSGITVERVKPIGPTPKNDSLKKMFSHSATMNGMTINALAGPYAETAGDNVNLLTNSLPKRNRLMRAPEERGNRLAPAPNRLAPAPDLKSLTSARSMEEMGLMDAIYAVHTEGHKKEPLVRTGYYIESIQKTVKDPFFRDGNPEWERLKAACENAPLSKQLDIVNVYWNNKITYASDEVLRGEGEYWAMPSETVNIRLTPELRKRIAESQYADRFDLSADSISAGDCEDYALAKYATLWNLGIGNDANMRIMFVQDQRQNDGGHAILAFQKGAQAVFLDNMFEDVQTMQSLDGRHRPVMSFSSRDFRCADVTPDSPTAMYKSMHKSLAAAPKQIYDADAIRIPQTKEEAHAEPRKPSRSMLMRM